MEFDVYVEDEHVIDYFYLEFTCVMLFTILIMVYLVLNYLLFRKAFLQRHEEDDEAKNRLQELQYVSQYGILALSSYDKHQGIKIYSIKQ